MIQRYKLVLVSKSPRRQELLKRMGLQFEVRNVEVDETFSSSKPDDIAKEISYKKALAIPTDWLKSDTWFITADTIVWADGIVFGKPKDINQAYDMLKKLAGRTHEVYSSICLRNLDYFELLCDRTVVMVAPMTDEEIWYYISHHNPMDKAGSYGAQDWLGISKIVRIDGSFYTVMALPTHLLHEALTKHGIIYYNNV